jgi:hypothetical protein
VCTLDCSKCGCRGAKAFCQALQRFADCEAVIPRCARTVSLHRQTYVETNEQYTDTKYQLFVRPMGAADRQTGLSEWLTLDGFISCIAGPCPAAARQTCVYNHKVSRYVTGTSYRASGQHSTVRQWLRAQVTRGCPTPLVSQYPCQDYCRFEVSCGTDTVQRPALTLHA